MGDNGLQWKGCFFEHFEVKVIIKSVIYFISPSKVKVEVLVI